MGRPFVVVAGDWTIHHSLPKIAFKGDKVKIHADELGTFDSALPAWIYVHF